MMGICTTLIGVLPTYAQIGVFAPILLVTLRIIQGWGQARKFPVPARCWRNMHQR